MRVSKILAAVAVTSLAVTPALATSAARLSMAKVVDAKVVNAKASTPAKKSNRLTGTTTVVAVLATAAVIGGAIALTDGDSDSD